LVHCIRARIKGYGSKQAIGYSVSLTGHNVSLRESKWRCAQGHFGQRTSHQHEAPLLSIP
jgi:hypothetical protein